MSTDLTVRMRAHSSLQGVVTILARVAYILLTCGVWVNGKVFDRCELAQVLHNKHRLDLHEVATWTCIAQHSSDFNTEAYAGGLAGGSHGLFQISDVYWCSPPGKGFACNLPCERLRDADLTDDLSCLRIIYAEHQRLSGDGYNAWNAYQQFCRHGVEQYVQDCFANQLTVKPAASQSYGYTAPFVNAPAPYYTPNALSVHTNAISTSYSAQKRGKVYDRCELAQELYYKHKMPMDQIPTWVCIAQHESRFDTSAVGRLNADGSADHGLFQISDLYWCSHDRYNGGKACGLQCTKLLDNDITDDVRCIKRIHGEHTRLSGDGFTAWTVYDRDCRNQQYAHVSACFKDQPYEDSSQTTHVHKTAHTHQIPSYHAPQAPAVHTQYQANPFLSNHIGSGHKSSSATTLQHQQHKYTSFPNTHTQTQTQTQKHKGKVYKRCELAQELYFKHKFPMQDIATWVCIAQHESNYDTAAVGRLNGDGSADHGLFQISDLYWCSHDSFGGKACNIPCAKLLDSDISDDVECVRIIYEEHTRLSGDGFTAWTVYNRNCRNRRVEDVTSCFDSNDISKTQQFLTTTTQVNGNNNNYKNNSISTTSTGLASPTAKGKVYKKCELAQELYFKHKMPMQDVPTWVCIAEHESSFNTAAVGRLNTDGSADHGLFQISDLYWCSHDVADGKACHISCNKLLDNDITDDVRCVKTIYEEHTRLSGDGFTAWTVYNRHCRNQQLDRVSSCFDAKELQRVQQASGSTQRERPNFNTHVNRINPITAPPKKIKHKSELNHPFVNNPFLNQYSAVKFVQTTVMPKRITTTSKPLTHNVATSPVVVTKSAFINNPFLNPYIQTQTQKQAGASKPTPQTLTLTNAGSSGTNIATYTGNPFLNAYKQTERKTHTIAAPVTEKPQKQNFQSNPFLSQYIRPPTSLTLTPTTQTTNKKVSNTREHVSLKHPQTQQKQAYHTNPFLTQFIDKPSGLTSITYNNRKATTNAPQRTQLHAQFQNNPFLQKISAPTRAQQHTRTTPSSTAKTKLHVYPTKPYVNSEVFRTTPVKAHAALMEPKPGSSTSPRKSVTTQRPQAQTTKQFYTTLLTTTTRKPTTLATVIRKPTLNSAGGTTKRPGTASTWNWRQPQQQVEPTKATTTRKTTRATKSATTATQKLLSTTRKPTTTTRKPTSTTRRPVTTSRKTTVHTTRAPPTTHRSGNIVNSTSKAKAVNTTKNPGTTRNPGLYQERKTTKATSKSGTTQESVNKKQQTTATKRPITTEHTGLKKPNTTTTTKRPTATQISGLKKPTTTTTVTKRPTTKQSATKTTSKAANSHTTANKKPNTTTSTRRPTTTAWGSTERNAATNTRPTRKTTTTVRISIPTKKAKSTVTTKTTTTRRPTTTAIQYNFSTTKVPYTVKKVTTPTILTQSTRTSALKPKVTTTKITASTKSTSTTRPPTTVATRKPLSYVASTTSFSTNVWNRKSNTESSKSSSAITMTNPYRDDPFSHPFFAKYKEQFEVFASTTTRKPASTTRYQLQTRFGEESEYFQQFRNHTAGNVKTVYAYAFGQNAAPSGKGNGK